MAIGEMSGIVQDRGLNILFRVTLNTLGNLTASGLTQSNTTGNDQKTGNTRLGDDTPKGILAGSVVAVDTVGGSGYIVAATGSLTNSNQPVGIAINSAVGYPYESSSGVSSGKLPYLHGSGTVFATDLYETIREDDATAVTAYAAGDLLYSSKNGLLINVSPTTDSIGTPNDTIIGVVLTAPTTADPFMVVQMRI